MTVDLKQEEKLLQFIKDNTPEAPTSPSNEEMNIWSAIENPTAKPWTKLFNFFQVRPWAYPVAVAALIAAVIIPQQAGMFRNEERVALQDQQIETYLQNTLSGAFYGEDVDANGLRDWYTLTAYGTDL